MKDPSLVKLSAVVPTVPTVNSVSTFFYCYVMFVIVFFYCFFFIFFIVILCFFYYYYYFFFLTIFIVKLCLLCMLCMYLMIGSAVKLQYFKLEENYKILFLICLLINCHETCIIFIFINNCQVLSREELLQKITKIYS